MKNAIQFDAHRVGTNGKNPYATPEDFEQLFMEQNTELLRLSLHLTADAAKAESCLTLAMRDCLFRSTVSKDRLHTWARRMVIRNAIRLVRGIRNDFVVESEFEFQLQASQFPLEGLRESVAILTLPDLDRLAFVICVVERYSILDCALLLGECPQKVQDAIVRAKRLILPLEQRTEDEPTAGLPGNIHCALGDQRNELYG